MKERNIWIMVLLTVVTAGFYLLFWNAMFQGQLKEQTKKGFGPIVHLLMLVFTFGIYAIYWQYAAGSRLAEIGAKDRSVLYLALCFIWMSWLNPFLMQNQANNIHKA
ncbi:MAG: DUF4234 domain-containing protein [Firmicutes bacterium]|nr:DUF4234 domain-containing protein [Bacillota bacterium]